MYLFFISLFTTGSLLSLYDILLNVIGNTTVKEHQTLESDVFAVLFLPVPRK